MDLDKSAPLPQYHELPPTSFPIPGPCPLPADLVSPPPEASPDAVRTYLIAVMQSRGLPLARAEELSQRWTMGTGRELREYPVAMFRDTFGPDGWVIYKEVKARFYLEEAKASGDGKKKGGKTVGGLICRWIFLIIFLGLLVGGIVLLKRGRRSNTPGGIFMIVIGVFGSLITSCTFLGTVSTLEDAEKKAERELKSDWDKNTTTTS